MSKAPRPRQRQVGGSVPNGISAKTTTMDMNAEADINGDMTNALDYTSSSSIIEFLAKEQDCNIEPTDPDAIFQEVSRLSDHTDLRSVDELILEAERLIQQQLRLNDSEPKKTNCTQTPSSTSPQSLSSPQNSIRLNTCYTRSIEHVQVSITPNLNQSKSSKAKSRKNSGAASSPPGHASKQHANHTNSNPPSCEQQSNFVAFVENLPSESVISEESTPKDLITNPTSTHNGIANGNVTLAQRQQHEQLDNTDDDEDTMEELTEAEVENHCSNSRRSSSRSYCHKPIAPMASYCEKAVGHSPKHLVSTLSSPIEHIACSVSREHVLKLEIEQLQEKLKDTEERLSSVQLQSESLSQTQRALREHNGRLQEESELLKLDVQHLHECASVLRNELQSARQDREEAIQMQSSLRSELEATQQERRRAAETKQKDGRLIQDLQRQCREMERILMRKHPDSVSALIIAAKNPGCCSMNGTENTLSSRQLLEQRIEQLESDAKDQDCKAQKILSNVQARFNSVQAKYERHIADLETQVLSLQEINTKLNEQIESQVRTLDRFMQKRADRYYNNCTQTDAKLTQFEPALMHCSRIQAITTGTQTHLVGSGAMRDHSTNTIGCPSPSIVCQQHLQQQLHSAASSSSASSTANSTPNTSRPNSKQSGNQRRMPPTIGSKLPISQSDSTLSLHSQGGGAAAGATAAGAAGHKEDSQLVSSVRSMRVDLAIKNKAMQRLTRELDDCKKTIRKLTMNGAAGGSRLESKLQGGAGGMSASCSNASRRPSDNHHHHYPQHYHDHTIPAMTENQALKEAQNKFHLLEADYKTLHEKRLHDLKTLQSAHERELSSSNETVRILKQRLNEREEAFATQKRRKIPVDYYALKAKVSLLERRHSEREERLHMLVDALSKGRLNGALEDLLQDNNNK